MHHDPFPAVRTAITKCPNVNVELKKEIDDTIGKLNETHIKQFKKLEDIASIGYVFACSEWLYCWSGVSSVSLFGNLRVGKAGDYRCGEG